MAIRECLALRGQVQGREAVFPLASGPNILGSDPTNHVVLDEDGVSRRHALLLVEADGLRLLDQESKNGTFVNGQRVLSAEIAVGDEIWIGPAELRLEALEPDEAQLAVEIRTAPPGQEGERRTTEALKRPPDPQASRWLEAVRRCCRVLGDPAAGPAAALAELLEVLELRGAAFVEISEDRSATVRAAVGELEGDLENALEAAAAEPGFTLIDPWTIHRQSTTNGSVALLLRGEFPRRGDSEPFLATLLTLFLTLAPGRPAVPSGRPAKSPLLFPEGHIRGVSEAARRLYAEMEPLAVGDLPVLLVGETGVGKEMLARALHLSSPRSVGPFVALNCAAIPAELLEAELFGIGKGVATGVAPRRGKLALADGGTLFLDEIGEMSVELQAKLLRALQEKEIQPLGERPVALDLRVLTATNIDIAERLESGTFRRDLYYRIAGAVLRVPPLRERPEDVPLFVDHFLHRFASEAHGSIRGLSVRVLRTLQSHPWPGNVRQLEHEIRRLVHLCPPGQAIRSELLSEEIRRGGDSPASISSTPLPTLNLRALEQQALEQALHQSQGNQTEAARLLGISRFTLRRRLARYGG